MKNNKEQKKKRDKKLLERKLVSKEKQREKRIILAKLDSYGRALYFRNEKIKKTYDVTIVCPHDFSLLNDKENFILFLNKVERVSLRYKSIFFDMINIDKIDFSGITCLISILLTLKKKKIKFEGSLPIEPHCREFLLKSDFFTHIAGITYNTDDEINVQLKNKTSNFITKGRKNVSPDIAGDANIMVSRQFFNNDNLVNDGLQVILLELMANTNNHAGEIPGSEHWFLSVQFDGKETVKFNFVDYGVGIFESLAGLGLFEKLRHFFTSNSECLKQMLEGEYHIKTSTGLSYRGKGIPSLKTALDRNHVNNLIIISNDAYGDLENNIFAKNKNIFSGTFISWEVNTNNEFINVNL